ncbi:MAG TPA: CHAT domain-containing protein [Candidatus Angelobacter sp.]|nr:CHAT domain-containing protein [Candidatus Angelobacter sp.]
MEGEPMNAPYRPCPDDEVLQELAAGLSSPELAERTLQHVSRCSICGPAVKRYLSEFSDQETPATTRILKQLESSKPEWQRRLVSGVLPPRRSRWPKLIPVFAGLAAVLLLFMAGPYFLREFKVRQAQKDVAAAFAERRTTENRLPSTEYSAFRGFPVELGPERSVDELPPALHNALSAAIENLKKPNADPRWLQIQGRAFLWEATPSSLEKAEKNFEKARAAGLNTPGLEIDLAAAYYERDNKSNHPNLQRTLDLLNKVLTEPNLTGQDRASALFNLAIAYERTQAWDLAVETWEKYLQVDSTSQWAEEARRRLKQGKEKTSARRQQSYSDPSFFLQQVAQGTLRPEDPEQYQQKALTEWLPVGLADNNSREYQALKALAGIFAEHQDFWWRDFLRRSGAADVPAVQALGTAISKNQQGSHQEALSQSKLAASLFSGRKNVPGNLFAGLQEVYALRRTLQAEQCLAKAKRLSELMARPKYTWLEAQFFLERGLCRNFHLELSKADADVATSLTLVKQSNFSVLRLRGLEISASIKRQQKSYDDCWNVGVEGLEQYWLGEYPTERLEQFYAVMFQSAEDAGYSYLSQALLQRVIAIRENPDSRIPRNLIREGMLHLESSNLWLAHHSDREAREQAKIASNLLGAAAYPDDFKAIAGIKSFENGFQDNDPAKALAGLQNLRPLIERTQYNDLALNYYRLLGDVQFRLQHFDQAASAYDSAIKIADAGLESLGDSESRLSWQRATDGSYRGRIRILLARKEDRHALEEWELYKGHAALHSGASEPAVVSATTSVTPHSFQVPLSPETRVVYASFRDGMEIWVVRDGHVQGNWVNSTSQELEKWARSFAAQCANPDSDLQEIAVQGRKLYSVLVQPVVSDIQPGQLVVVELDKPAYGVPLEALTTPGGRYLGQEYSIVYSPGILAEQQLRKARAIQSSDPVLLLDAVHSPNSVALPGMELEEDAIAKAFPRSAIMRTDHATLTDVNGAMAQHAILHYSGHAIQSGNGAQLVLNPKQFMGSQELAKAPLGNTQLVVLAACSSGRGARDGLMDPQSLIHSIFVTGVPMVVASQWNVDSESTSELMVSFYLHLAEQSPVPTAMLQARREMLKKNSHPYYWAGFMVTGRVS